MRAAATPPPPAPGSLPAPPPAEGWPAFVAQLGPRSLGTALLLALLTGSALSPIFVTPFWVVTGRTAVLALLLLLVFAVAGALPAARLPRWLPRWLLQVLAVGLAAPLVTFGLYLAGSGGSFAAFLETPARVRGFLWIAGTALVVGLVIALGALLREREASARTQALRFALEKSQLERQALDARLALLHSQIEPHFLFNTLANVQALVEAGSPRAPAVLQSLIDYLRAAMPRLADGEATLGHELALVRAYLQLMQMRMPDRLQWAVQAEPALEARRFPPMALLTLVENAVRHGIDPAEDGGRIEVGAAALPHGGWRVWVTDTGVGLAATARRGTGLANLEERLRASFGPAARLELSEASASPPRGLRAEIVLPAA